MIDIDKAIKEHREEFDAMMEKHRALMAQQDKEIIELRERIDAVIAEHGKTLRGIFTEKKKNE